MNTLGKYNWNQFYYFHEVATRQSIKQTADFLEVSSATLSEHIRKLEDSLKRPLFDRSNNQIRLNQFGEEVYEFTKEMFEVGKRMLDQVTDIGGALGGYAVRVGVQDNLFELASIEFISRYSDLYAPFGTIHTERERHGQILTDKLFKGNYDWIVSLDPISTPGLIGQKISTFEIEFACLKDVYSKFKDDRDLFSTIPLALSSWDRKMSRLIKTHLMEQTVYPEEMIESDHRDFSWRLMERGRAIVPVAREVTHEVMYDENIQYFRIGEPLSFSLYAAWQRSSEKRVGIQKLRQLLELDNRPITYDDPELLLKINEVPKEKLK